MKQCAIEMRTAKRERKKDGSTNKLCEMVCYALSLNEKCSEMRYKWTTIATTTTTANRQQKMYAGEANKK